MLRGLLAVAGVGLTGLLPALAQDNSNDQPTPQDNGQTVLQKVRGGAVRERAPGRIIDQARARHAALRDARLAAQRSGDTSGLAPEGLGPATTGATNALTNLLGDLLGSGILGGLSGGDISSILGNLTGGSGTTGGSTTGATGITGNSGGTGPNIPSNIPPEAIQLIQNAGIDINQLFAKPRAPTATAADKDRGRSQAATPDQQQPKFVVRWVDAMLSTLFTALTVGFQSPDFVSMLADFIRPLFPAPTEPIPPDEIDSADTTGSDTGDGTPAEPNSVVWVPHAGPRALTT